MANKNNVVIVFDFDKTIIDVDSDNWVVDELGFTDLFDKLLPTMPWNSLMDRMMKELHDHGKTIDEIKQVLRRVPIHPRVITAIKSAHALGGKDNRVLNHPTLILRCELRIVSDANTLFIETIVEDLGISEFFSEINTNPVLVDEQGRLKIFPYHDFTKSSHGCSRCPPNMCKGLIIERIQASLTKEGNKMKMVYLGDGAGDYCPSLKLKIEDYMMPRKNFPVWDLISQNPNLVKATVRDWTDGEAMERILMGTINEIISSEEEEKMLSSDNCKISVGIVHEPLLPLTLQNILDVIEEKCIRCLKLNGSCMHVSGLLWTLVDEALEHPQP
ncbi:hypothetical protein AALP_AA1G196200 [Arabis alpina]|uniref:Uncharacterized protein n=1 Tax=Arabis alpina TaxID=50452 RepID=A0A087HPA3_ARAAL|nr:hypothetical protein AALP_AA1G196200 [Arabis alpina]